MALLDKLKAAGGAAAEKAKDAAEIGKLKLKISSAENEMKSVYGAMGKKLMEENAELASQLFGEDVAKIAELKEQIEALTAQIAAVKETTGEPCCEEAAEGCCAEAKEE